MNKSYPERDELKVHLIDFDDVPAHSFPFFTSYRMFFDEEIKCYGFFHNEEIVAVAAVIPDDPNSESTFMSVGCPIIYVFEVREDVRRKGFGQISAEILVRDIIESDTVQLCCSPFVTPFWQKVGFNISFFDQSLYMHRMVLKKEKSVKEE
ncbi:MAG: GNAT family N-acetyltransferase [Candidatus Heimdallarchaeota archaeon]|nr:GNAT family N-acetyltransferase [Candidatus Heimdallarchaeota archaeon]